MQGRYNLFADQFDGTHYVGVGHRTLVAVYVQVAGVEPVNNHRQLFPDGIRAAHDNVVGILQFFIGHHATESAGSGKGALDIDRLPRLVPGRIVVLAGPAIAMFLSPQEFATNFLSFLVGVGAENPEQITEVFRARFESGFTGGFDIHVAQAVGVFQQRTQVHVGMLVASRPHYALRAAESGEPDGWVGFLHREHPRVHRSIMVILAFVAERTRLGPALDDEVVGFFESVPVLWRSDSTLQGFNRRAAHESGDDPATRDTVQHGNLFRHADGIIDGDHVA